MRSCFLSSFVKFPIGPKNSNSVLISCIMPCYVQRFQRRSRKCLRQSETWAVTLVCLSARKTQTWCRTLRSCFMSCIVEFRSAVPEEKATKTPGQSLWFFDQPENTNLVEDVEILHSVKFRWIPFRSSSGEVENVSANQRPRQLS